MDKVSQTIEQPTMTSPESCLCDLTPLRRNLGYYLHPSINNTLPASAANVRIADIACGTGDYLRGLSELLPDNAQLDGFDVSDKQFMKPQELPPNVNLHVVDAKEPFDPKYHGQYDVVHIRLLVAAMKDDAEWEMVTQNVLQLLKPGGAIQWEEGDFINSSLYRGRDAKANGKVLDGLLGALLQQLRPRFERSLRILDGFEKQGLVGLKRDKVASDNCITEIPTVRKTLATVSLDAAVGWALLSKALEPDEIAQAKSEAMEAIEAGVYNSYSINAFIGFMKQDTESPH